MESLQSFIQEQTGKTCAQCSNGELYRALLAYVKGELAGRGYQDGQKKLYYLSAEFLTGKLLSNNLINLGIYSQTARFLQENGKSLAEIEEIEPEPSLGNGGLGRLAACFLDSIATLGLPGEGIGLNYHLGLFKQEFRDLLQRETPNPWLPRGCWLKEPCWLTPTDVSYTVPYRGFTLQSRMYDMDVSGYGNKSIRLHLFDTDIVDETIVEDGISFDKRDILHNLTLFLYPDDSGESGRKLRLYQQYFMVSSAAQYILDEAVKRGCTLRDLPSYVVIQINDTHPSLIIPELIRLLELRGLSFEEACGLVSQVCAYTNHTILAEALEKWPIAYLEDIVPQLARIIRRLDQRMKARYPQEAVAILDGDGLVHMAHMDIHYGFSINGVAALHTEILKSSELKPFYEIYPEKFNNKTNGVTFRRWLLHCNQELSGFISTLIGGGFQRDSFALEQLLAFQDDPAALRRLLDIKAGAKAACRDFILSNTGIEVDADSVFDIQIKRLHEYKRQQLNALYVIRKYLDLKAGYRPARPVTFIFGAKAAPAYTAAKDIIHLLLCLQALLRDSPEAQPYLKLVMVENYNVTAAEKLIPACDISEQISLASKEASGTGNMKFMLNGAVTLGTMDGANVEISQLVGPENIYIFGQSSQEVIEHYEKGDYSPRAIYDGSRRIRECVDFLTGEELMAVGHPDCLQRLHQELTGRDRFMTLLDFNDYIRAKDQALSDYNDRMGWAKKMLVNIAKAGYFSSDRTVAEYNRDIWRLR